MGLLSFLFGCQGEPPFAQKDGIWHYRTATIVGSDATSFKVLSDQTGCIASPVLVNVAENWTV